MNLFNIFKKSSKVDEQSSPPKPAAGSVFSQGAGFLDKFETTLKSTSYAAIRLRADAISSTKFILKKRDIVLDENHWLNKLFSNPNPEFRRNEIFRLVQMYLDISGNCYIYVYKSKFTNKPSQMWILQSHRVSINVGKDNTIESYKYTYGNKTMYFMPDEIIHLRTLLPSMTEQYDYIGKGVTDSIKDLIGSDDELNKFLRRYLANDALPPMILSTPDELGQEQWDLFQQKWNLRLPQHKLLATLSGGMEVKPIEGKSLSAGVGSLKDLNQIVTEKISTIFGIPYEKLIGRSTSLASALVNDYTFRNDTIRPLLVDLTEAFTKYFSNIEDGIIVEFEPYVYKDENIELNKREFKLSHGLSTINELRGEDGKEPIKDGDKIYIPSSYTELTTSEGKPEDTKDKPEDTKEDKTFDYNIKNDKYKYTKEEETWKAWKDKNNDY